MTHFVVISDRIGRLHRGREGYYILWMLPADAPSWESRGGWQQGSGDRAVRS